MGFGTGPKETIERYGRRVEMPDGSVIISPWLSTEDAAAYLGWGVDTFRKKARYSHLPSAGDGHPRFHRDVLDQWFQDMSGAK